MTDQGLLLVLARKLEEQIGQYNELESYLLGACNAYKFTDLELVYYRSFMCKPTALRRGVLRTYQPSGSGQRSP